jgi:hypothetical protein
MYTLISTTTSILIRIKNTAMSISTSMIMNTSMCMNTNIRTRGNPMCTIMSIKVNMALMIINIPDMKKKSIDTKIQRKKAKHTSK